MSFAADLKDFASNFRDTYKVLHESGKDELAREQAAYLREQRDASARGEATFQSSRNIAGLNAGDQRYTPAEGGLNTSGKLPTFARDPFDVAVRTVYGEAASQSPEGQQAVAATLVNRSKASGRSVAEEALKPNQYEPWNNPAARRRMLSLDPSSPTYQAIAERIRPVLEGKADPTQGATHFYAPKAQRALGRSTPSWATSGGFDIGDHRFYRLPYSGQGSHGIGKRAALDLEDPEDGTEPVVYAATGGVIPSGWDRMNDTTESESAGSNPVTRDVMDTRRAGITDEDYDPRSLVDIEGARQAVAGGLKFGQRLLGLETHHAAVPEAAQVNPDGVTALQTNAGAPPREQIQMIHQTVDPKGELPPELRDIAGYNALQKFWTARGEPQKADAAAWNMLQSAKKAVSQYGAMALSVDDPVKRAQLIARAHNEYLPDGEVMKITGKSGDGAKFELFNNKGDLTEKGVLAMDDMVKMATGMHNGTAYLQTMVKFATDAPTHAEKRMAKDQEALGRFTEADDSVVLSSMTDSQIKDLKDMSPAVRSRAIEEKRKAMKFEYGQEQDALKRDDKIENRDYQRDWSQFKTALAQNNFDLKRHDVLTNAERKFFLYEKDLDDRNKRFDQSQTARKERDTERARSILEGRAQRAEARGIKLPPREVAERQRQAGVENTAADRMAAIDTAASDETGVNLTAEQRARRGAIAVGATFDRNLKEDDKSRKGRAEAMSETYDELAKLYPDRFDVSPTDGTTTPKKGVSPELLNNLTGASVAAADIVRSTGLPAPVAARAIKEVIDRKRPIQIEQRGADTLVHLGNDIPPVRMSEDGFLQIMRMVGAGSMSKDQIQALQGPSWTNSPALPTDVRAPKGGGRQSILGRVFEPVRDTPPNRAPSYVPPRRAIDLEPALPEPGRKNTLINRMIDQYRR